MVSKVAAKLKVVDMRKRQQCLAEDVVCDHIDKLHDTRAIVVMSMRQSGVVDYDAFGTAGDKALLHLVYGLKLKDLFYQR